MEVLFIVDSPAFQHLTIGNSKQEKYVTHPQLRIPCRFTQSTLTYFFVKLNNSLGEGVGEHFEEVGGLAVARGIPQGDHHGPRDGLQEAGGRLHNHQQDHRHPVEHVVDGCTGKGPKIR